MSKKCYRFFGGLLTAQGNWLNKMSQKGYCLIRAGKMLYEEIHYGIQEAGGKDG